MLERNVISVENVSFNNSLENDTASSSKKALDNISKEYGEKVYFNNKEYYSLDNNDYGILIHKKGEQGDNLITYSLTSETDENYYIFFYWKSIHIGSLNETTYSTAFELMQVFNNETI